jgi:hypothetical protein
VLPVDVLQEHCTVLLTADPLTTSPTPPASTAHAPALLQEASSYQPAVRPERRRQVIDEMVAYAPAALQILASCLSAQAAMTHAKEQVLEAFTSWLKLTGGAGLTGPMLMQSPLARCVGGVGACVRAFVLAGWLTGWLAGCRHSSTMYGHCPAVAGSASEQEHPKHSLSCTGAPTHRRLLLWAALQHTCRAALEGLRDADTFFPAVDAVVELIYCTSHRGRPKDDMAPLVQLIVPEVMALKPRCGGLGWVERRCGRE